MEEKADFDGTPRSTISFQRLAEELWHKEKMVVVYPDDIVVLDLSCYQVCKALVHSIVGIPCFIIKHKVLCPMMQ